jgi:hypothetical protein
VARISPLTPAAGCHTGQQPNPLTNGVVEVSNIIRMIMASGDEAYVLGFTMQVIQRAPVRGGDDQRLCQPVSAVAVLVRIIASSPDREGDVLP